MRQGSSLVVPGVQSREDWVDRPNLLKICYHSCILGTHTSHQTTVCSLFIVQYPASLLHLHEHLPLTLLSFLILSVAHANLIALHDISQARQVVCKSLMPTMSHASLMAARHYVYPVESCSQLLSTTSHAAHEVPCPRYSQYQTSSKSYQLQSCQLTSRQCWGRSSSWTDQACRQLLRQHRPQHLLHLLHLCQLRHQSCRPSL